MKPHEHSTAAIGDIRVNMLLGPAESGGRVGMYEFEVPSGAQTPGPQRHEAFAETVYGVEGVMTFTLDGAVYELHPGQTLVIDRGVVHRFENRGVVGARWLAIVDPGVIDVTYFRDLAGGLTAAEA